MGQALYRKYRSKSLAEVVGQEHVTTTLANALKSGRISHAYLLSGPRGVGKTSIARILAHEINDLPYTDETHLDIIEIDAASNRRIDEIRDLRERVTTAPANAKYKVYIIDEVHMLTKEAFNALLKTLEEPPAHVIFILATTEAHKLPETILSRTQRYTLRPIPLEQVVSHLKEIAKGEQITIDDDAVEVVAKHGGGSFRDSISLLDQASSISEHITRADVERILGLAPDEYITKLASAVTDNDTNMIVITLADLYTQGFEPAMIATQLGSLLRTELLSGKNSDPQAVLSLLANLLDVPAARNPRQLLEIVLLKSTFPVHTAPESATVPAPRPTVVTPKPTPVTQPPTMTQKVKTDPMPAPAKTAAMSQPKPLPEEEPINYTSDEPPVDGLDADEIWHGVLEIIKKQYNTLYGIARMAHPELNGTRLVLSFKFAFHQKRVNEARNRKLLTDALEQVAGQPLEIVCVVAEASKADSADVSAISNIFGGAELIES